jgi:hypothetical protein
MVTDGDLTALIEAGNNDDNVRIAVWLDAEAQHLAGHPDDPDPTVLAFEEGQRAIEQYQRDVVAETEGMDQDQLNEWSAQMDAWRAAVAQRAEADAE